MSKEQEVLERIKQEFNCDPEYYGLGVDFEILESALHRLESIDNSNPSEALECLEKLKGMEISSMPFSDEYGTQEVDLNDIRKVGSQLNTDFREYTTTIRQALLKAQEQETFFDDKLVFKNGCIMSGFDYKGKQIVAMPLEEYDEFMKQEKALKIIFEKNVNTLLLELAENVDEYNERIVPNGKLTEEEFNLLKEMLE